MSVTNHTYWGKRHAENRLVRCKSLPAQLVKSGAWFSALQGLMIRSIRDRHILIQFNSIVTYKQTLQLQGLFQLTGG